jgi:hypothetical protein
MPFKLLIACASLCHPNLCLPDGIQVKPSRMMSRIQHLAFDEVKVLRQVMSLFQISEISWAEQ